jgi:hypothetical protein
MVPATRRTQSEVRRTLTCAALATITTIGTFSLIANLMTPMFAGVALLSGIGSAQEARTGTRPLEETACIETAYLAPVDTAHVQQAGETQKPAAI